MSWAIETGRDNGHPRRAEARRQGRSHAPHVGRRMVAGLALTVACAGIAYSAAQTDPVLDAMQAELKRSMTLTLNQLDKPYYLSYTVDDEHTWSATATLGGLVSSSNSDFRVPRLRMRVGDYKFDNSNWTGANAAGPRYNLRNFPIEDENPLVLRQYLWLATDSAFKGGLQSIARKRAALRNVTVSEELPDFAPAPAVRRDTRLPAGEIRFEDCGTIARDGFPLSSTPSQACAIPMWNTARSIPCIVS